MYRYDGSNCALCIAVYKENESLLHRYIRSELMFWFGFLMLFKSNDVKKAPGGGVYSIPDTPSQSSEQSKIEKNLSDTQPSIFSKKTKKDHPWQI